MATAADLITTALRKLVAVPAGDAPSSAELADGLTDLNGVIDSLNADGLYIYTIQPAAYTLTISTAAYTIGTGGTFNETRPPAIEEANMIDLSVPAYPARKPMRIVEASEWARIAVQAVTSPMPTVLHYDKNYAAGLGTIKLWPTPSAANQVEIFRRQLLTAFALSTPVVFPPGYYELLWSELCIRVAADYDKQVSQAVIQINTDARRRVEAANTTTPYMQCDGALLRISRPGSFDLRSNQ